MNVDRALATALAPTVRAVADAVEATPLAAVARRLVTAKVALANVAGSDDAWKQALAEGAARDPDGGVARAEKALDDLPADVAAAAVAEARARWTDALVMVVVQHVVGHITLYGQPQEMSPVDVDADRLAIAAIGVVMVGQAP